ncbi:MAG: hypothetical protein FI672_03645 [SAR202 cluster bacterium]|nr:hypothetical protein [SAR202 cluster bacterium]MQG51660.1 hypothetical protein [SAR202 cluster bacterium]|tara:strand:+ start:896 stop:1084 length:189 start_codon:yes stop_codon:yes gene_type:complete
MTNDKVVNNSYELLKSKYSDSFDNNAKKDIEDIISQLYEISETLKKYKLDHDIQPFNAKPLE